MTAAPAATTVSVDAVCARLRATLVREELRPGDRLGDERSLAAQLGVSRAALRRALERMEADGAIRRTIGRGGGIVVADGRVERNLNTVEGLPEIARYQGIRLETRVLRIEMAVAGPRDRRLLRLADGAAIHRVTRVRSADGSPLSLESSRFPADLFPGLAAHDLGSLYRTLRTAYGVTPDHCDETLELTAADADQAAHLAVDEGAPLIHVQRTALAADGRPIELADELFVGRRMRFHLHGYGYVKVDRIAAPHCNDPP